jgi:hypothetical protein
MIYFVTETFLKAKTPITQNVDVNEITPFIETNADMRIQPILGTFFYDDLLTKYNAQTLSADETTLVSKIQPCIAWYSAADAVFTLTYQLKNKGLQKQSGDFSESVTREEVSDGIEYYESRAAFYEQRLRVYLKENKDLFSNYTSTSNTDSDMKPSTDTDNTGYASKIEII